MPSLGLCPRGHYVLVGLCPFGTMPFWGPCPRQPVPAPDRRTVVAGVRAATVDGDDWGGGWWSGPGPAHTVRRSRLRYWIASARCDVVISSSPARSAIVRATRRMRV